MIATTDHGLITVQSRLTHAETVAALTGDIRKRGATIFAEIDHAKGAAEVDLSLRPTTVILFGNAKAGTPLMQQAQTVGIDLPLKLLVWEDGQRNVWVSYNAPAWTAARHGIAEDTPVLKAMTMMLEALAASIR